MCLMTSALSCYWLPFPRSDALPRIRHASLRCQQLSPSRCAMRCDRCDTCPRLHWALDTFVFGFRANFRGGPCGLPSVLGSTISDMRFSASNWLAVLLSSFLAIGSSRCLASVDFLGWKALEQAACQFRHCNGLYGLRILRVAGLYCPQVPFKKVLINALGSCHKGPVRCCKGPGNLT